MALRRVVSTLSSKITAATTTTTTTTQRHLRRNLTSGGGGESEKSENKLVYNRTTVKGPNCPHLISPTADGFFFRLDMPGIQKSDLQYTVDGCKIRISAQESNPHGFGSGHCEPRYYEAELELDPEVYNPERTTVQVNSGVLWVTVRKNFLLSDPGWYSYHIGRVKCKVDRDGNAQLFALDESDGTYKLYSTVKMR